jgi:hypothetical protein
MRIGVTLDDALIWSISKSTAALERIGEARRLHAARSATMRG